MKISDERFECMHDVNILENVCSDCEALFRQVPENTTGYDLVTLPDGSRSFKAHVPTQCLHNLSFDEQCGQCARIQYFENADHLTDEEFEEFEACLDEGYGEVVDSNGNIRATSMGDYTPSKPLILMNEEQQTGMSARQAEWEKQRRFRDES